MCEINPKRVRRFELAFFTAHEMSDERWDELTLGGALDAEQRLNATGEVRAHVDELEDEGAARGVVGREVWVAKTTAAMLYQPERGKIVATGLLSDEITRYYVVEVGDGDARVVFNGEYDFA